MNCGMPLLQGQPVTPLRGDTGRKMHQSDPQLRKPEPEARLGAWAARCDFWWRQCRQRADSSFLWKILETRSMVHWQCDEDCQHLLWFQMLLEWSSDSVKGGGMKVKSLNCVGWSTSNVKSFQLLRWKDKIAMGRRAIAISNTKNTGALWRGQETLTINKLLEDQH